MQLLQVPYPDIVIPMANVPSFAPPTMVVMAFRACIYSTPMYVASADTNLTVGYGFIQTLSLMLSFSKCFMYKQRMGAEYKQHVFQAQCREQI